MCEVNQCEHDIAWIFDFVKRMKKRLFLQSLCWETTLLRHNLLNSDHFLMHQIVFYDETQSFFYDHLWPKTISFQYHAVVSSLRCCSVPMRNEDTIISSSLPNVIVKHSVCSCFRYCDPIEAGGGVIVPEDCPTGSFCPLNTESKLHYPCPAGTFSNETNLEDTSHCKPCTGGFFCESPG